MALHSYIPQDRLRALARGEALPERTSGAALFADISGFTTLTEALARTHGERAGIEALSEQVNAIYAALIAEVERHGGSVIGFCGDAITCWFDACDAEPARRAVLAGLAMQQAMRAFAGLTVKVAVGSGAARRLAVGDPGIQRIDVVAGATLSRTAAGEGLARAGELLVDEATASALQIPQRDVRSSLAGEPFVVVDPAWGAAHPGTAPARAALPPEAIGLDALRPWILPFVFERESAGDGLFATDLRPATALFVRFTGIDYDHDEQAADTLHVLVSQAQRVLQDHGGALLELTLGDKGSYLYASFGAAQVHEDDARRALRAALALRERLASRAVSVQMGLSSGTMRVGGYGGPTRRSFGAMGDDVNTAARLMGIAQPGEILVSGRMRHAVARDFTLEARPPMPMKGKAEPMPVFAVAGARRERAVRLQEPVSALPMVGREAPCAVLAAKLAAAGEGRGQIVSLVAEAGLGKSRLAAEAIRLAHRSRWIGYGGACQQGGIRTPYLVWQPVWLALFGIDPALPLRRQLRTIEAELEERAPAHVEAWPLLGAALGLDWPDNDFTRALQPKDRKALLETVLLQCLASAAREAADDGIGLLVVLEDLHAADPLSLDLLVRVAAAIETLPLLMVLTCRPGDGDHAAPGAELAALPWFETIELDGLDAAQTEQVIRAKLAALFPERVGPVPAALIERIGERAQGNPFYVEEVLNYLHDRGIDPRTLAHADALELPASLHSLVLSRIDQLTAPQQLSLKAASIIGRMFRVLDLHRYHPPLGELDAVKQSLRELDRLGLTPLASPEPELSYLFKHRVTLDVGYENIAHATRARLHGQYASYLEAAYPEQLGPLAPQLAHHYTQAGIADKACHYLRRAGEQAAAGYANDEALGYFARALERLPADAKRDRIELILQCEAIFDLQGRHEEGRRALADVERLAQSLGDARLQSRIASRKGKLEIDMGDYAAARRHAQQAIEVIEAQVQAESASAPLAAEALIDALVLEARAMHHAGEAEAARAPLARALTLARARGYVRGEIATLGQLGFVHWLLGHYDDAEAVLSEALRLVQTAGDPRGELDIRNHLGLVAKVRSRHAQAVTHYEGAKRIAQRIGDPSWEAKLLNNIGAACLASGDFHRAGLHCDEAVAIFARLNEPTLLGSALLNRGEAHRELGQYAPARAATDRALALLRAAGLKRGEATALDNLGLVALALGRHDEALQLTEAARAIAHAIGVRALEAGSLLHLGQIRIATGRHAEAQQALDAAAALMRELGAEQPALEVQAAQAQLTLGRRGEAAEALGHLDGLLPRLLRPASDEASDLPLWLHLACWQVLQACGDPRAATLLDLARRELRARSDRIPDATVRRDYLDIAEHRAIMRGGTA